MEKKVSRLVVLSMALALSGVYAGCRNAPASTPEPATRPAVQQTQEPAVQSQAPGDYPAGLDTTALSVLPVARAALTVAWKDQAVLYSLSRYSDLSRGCSPALVEQDPSIGWDGKRQNWVAVFADPNGSEGVAVCVQAGKVGNVADVSKLDPSLAIGNGSFIDSNQAYEAGVANGAEKQSVVDYALAKGETLSPDPALAGKNVWWVRFIEPAGETAVYLDAVTGELVLKQKK